MYAQTKGRSPRSRSIRIGTPPDSLSFPRRIRRAAAPALVEPDFGSRQMAILVGRPSVDRRVRIPVITSWKAQ